MGFQNIDLNTNDVKIKGDFTLKKDNGVDSTISLRFTKDLLMQSSKFRRVLSDFVDEEELTFGFQLSGWQDAMNFQWLPSNTKQRIQSRIPDFIERRIERAVDQKFK